jgi:hypothetical protein
MRTPPPSTFRLEPNKVKKSPIAKNAKSCFKVLKIGLNGLFLAILVRFPLFKAKKGSKYTILYHFDKHFFFPQFKNGYSLPFRLGFTKIPYPFLNLMVLFMDA